MPALGFVHMIVHEGLFDPPFAGETIGFDDLTERVAGYTPGRVSEVTWVRAPGVRASRRVGHLNPVIRSNNPGVRHQTILA